MEIKGYSAFPKAPALLDPRQQIVKCHIQFTSLEGLTPLQWCSRCILQISRLGHLTSRILFTWFFSALMKAKISTSSNGITSQLHSFKCNNFDICDSSFFLFLYAKKRFSQFNTCYTGNFYTICDVMYWDMQLLFFIILSNNDISAFNILEFRLFIIYCKFLP